MHTHKAKIPFKIVLLVLLVLAAPTLFVYAMKRPNDRGNIEETTPEKAQGKGGAVQSAQQPLQQSNRPMTAQEYVERYTLRVAGLEHSAPVYDEITKAVRAPVPPAYVVIKRHCGCYSLQGTRLQMTGDQCKTIVDNGYFLAFDPEPQKAQQQPVTQPAYAMVAMASSPPDIGSKRRLDPVDLAVLDEPDSPRHRVRR
ncbi:hypothetical protein [Cupriavidus basilensis]